MSDNPLLRVEIAADYAGKPVLRDVRFSLQPGEVLGMVGTSGAGKSTLVQALLGLLPWRGGCVRGQVLLDGEAVHLRERAMQQLTPMERTAFVLRHMEDQPIGEIAEALGVPANSAKQAVFRAVGKLRRALRADTTLRAPLVKEMR